MAERYHHNRELPYVQQRERPFYRYLYEPYYPHRRFWSGIHPLRKKVKPAHMSKDTPWGTYILIAILIMVAFAPLIYGKFLVDYYTNPLRPR